MQPLQAWNQPIYAAFNILSGSRQWTMGGAAAIPFSEMLAFITWRGLSEVEAEDWLHLLRELDGAYLEEVNKEKD